MSADSLFTPPSRSHIISSARFRKFEEYTNAQFGTIYHRILGLLGDTRTLVVCNTMTNLAFARLLASPSEGMVERISPFTSEIIYPQHTRATCDRELGYFACGIVGQQRLFVTSQGIDPRVRLSRTSNTSKTSSAVWAILENELTNVITSEVPYLARFAALSDPGQVDLTITIGMSGASFTANAVRVIPVPIAGATTLASLTHSGGLPLYTNNHTLLEPVSVVDDARSKASFISFEPVKSTSLSFSFLSDLYSSVLRCTAIGISLIEVFYNVYAQVSYFGVKLTPPEGASKIAKVATEASPFAPSLEGVQYYFYADRASFDGVSSGFVAVTGPNQFTDIPADDYYMLVELRSTNNTTPVIQRIELTYE